MGKSKFLDFLRSHTDKVKDRNKKSARQETASPKVFKSMKQKIREAQQGIRDEVDAKGKPVSMKQRMRQKLQEARRENEQDSSVKTAPPEVFDAMDKRIDQLDKQRRNRVFKQIAEEYDLDLSLIPDREMHKLNNSFDKDMDNFMKNYAHRFRKAGA